MRFRLRNAWLLCLLILPLCLTACGRGAPTQEDAKAALAADLKNCSSYFEVVSVTKENGIEGEEGGTPTYAMIVTFELKCLETCHVTLWEAGETSSPWHKGFAQGHGGESPGYYTIKNYIGYERYKGVGSIHFLWTEKGWKYVGIEGGEI